MWCCKGSHNFSLGTVYLQDKLSVSSIDSVELEIEGRLLLQDRDTGLRSIRSTMSTLPFMLQEYRQAIISAVWMIILSLIPQGQVWAGVVLLGFLIIVHAMRPQILIKILQLRLSSLEGNLQDAIDSGIMRQLDTSFTEQFTRDVGE